MSIQNYAPLGCLPAPTASGTTVSFTDPWGEVWVARSTYAAGAWRKARDVLHGYAYRSATGLAMPTANATIQFDTVLRDVHGMWNAATWSFVLPIAGWWWCYGAVTTAATAAGYYIQGDLMAGPAASMVGILAPNVTNAVAGGMYYRAYGAYYAAAQDNIRLMAYLDLASQTVTTGQGYTKLEVSYMGTG